MEKAQLAKILKTAVRGEEDGFTFYDLLSRKATNPEVERKLENLRNDEAAQEKALYELLTAEREAMSGDYYWFGYDESAPLEH